jgi:hypothetical protein
LFLAFCFILMAFSLSLSLSFSFSLTLFVTHIFVVVEDVVFWWCKSFRNEIKRRISSRIGITIVEK